MVCRHLEHREVLARLPDVVDVVEPHAGLGDREGVRGRTRGPADDPRLERVHARLGEEHVPAPSGDERGALHPRVVVRLEERQEVLPHRAVRELLLERRGPDEVVLLARGLTARLVDAEGPEGLPALRTGLAGEALLPEDLDLVVRLGHGRQRKGSRALRFSGAGTGSSGGTADDSCAWTMRFAISRKRSSDPGGIVAPAAA